MESAIQYLFYGNIRYCMALFPANRGSMVYEHVAERNANVHFTHITVGSDIVEPSDLILDMLHFIIHINDCPGTV